MNGLYTEDSVKKLSNALLDIHSHNEKIIISVDVLDKLIPVLLSSLFTIFSAITSSFIYDYSSLLYNIAYIIGLIFGIILFLYILYKVGSKMWTFSGIEAWRKIYIQQTDKHSELRDRYKGIYEKNLIKSIKSMLYELSEVAFVILFPGGICDILIGIAQNSPQIGLNGTIQIEKGIALVFFSILFLSVTIIGQVKRSKNRLYKKREKMESHIREIDKILVESSYCKFFFKKDEIEID